MFRIHGGCAQRFSCPIVAQVQTTLLSRRGVACRSSACPAPQGSGSTLGGPVSTTVIRPAAIGDPCYGQLLACTPESASAARRLVSSALEAWGIEELCDDAAQIVSELVTNAITHTECATFFLTVEHRREGCIRISAEDAALGLLPSRRTPGDDSLGGRGLRIVQDLCARWGYDLHPSSKTVWAELVAPHRGAP
ncbi:ATP-binding protein [Streptomyces uncialis]|uniref:ATP-binding protein n=1 Tax=Streptomyces uncialis TaxID=1048205 RepID=UPI0037A54391